MTSYELSSASNGRNRGPCSDSEPFQGGHRLAVCLVGAGWRFTSGISYYTCLLANALADDYDTSVIQMRQLLPRRFYPGWRRVGQHRSRVAYRSEVSVYDGVNWWWGRSLVRALTFMAARQPDVLVLQWWTATVLHTYIALALRARLLGTRVILEIHELQDPAARNAPSSSLAMGGGVSGSCFVSARAMSFTLQRTKQNSKPTSVPEICGRSSCPMGRSTNFPSFQGIVSSLVSRLPQSVRPQNPEP